MDKIYHLSSCSTCQRILQEFELSEFELQDIKEDPITEEQLDSLREVVGSYEKLFSRRARKYRGLGLHKQTLTEEEYRSWILKEYTFLKRPVIIVADQVFVGSSKTNIEAALVASTRS